MSRIADLFLGKDAEKVKAEDPPAAGPSSYKILFVDDEENVLKAMRRIFRQETYTILTAVSAADALDILARETVNVVVSDHRMPGMTGADLLRQIKQQHPQTIRIMLTGYADVNAVMGAVNEGAVYKFITKPWNDDDLRLTISLALEQYDLLKENQLLKRQTADQEKKLKKLSRFVNVNRSQIGALLVRRKMLAKDQLEKAQALQAKSQKLLPQALMELGFIEEDALLRLMEQELNFHRVLPNEFTVPKVLAALIPKEICGQNLLVPLKKTNGRLMVAMADPTDYAKVADLEFISGLPIQPVLARQSEITAKLGELYGDSDTLDAVLSEADLNDPTETIEIVIDDEEDDLALEDLLQAKDQPPAIRLVNAIISDALRHMASDIHIEPKTKHVLVRYRIDGLLQEKLHIPIHLHAALVSRIKVMAELDIAERRRPQDGRITVKTSSRLVDLRISSLPTISGEKVVLRVLDKNAAIKDIEELGFGPADLEKTCRFIDQPQGMVLVTGPTGSGKTSTLYALLRKGATMTKNFTTIEEPVEYFMGMAEQVNIREKIGLSFPVVLRAILRQDPNVIMLGEIRDFETAEVAFHAALTGHLVLSTLHTNSSIASIVRLRDMGVQPYVISEALNGIIAQRLVRNICPHCKGPDHPEADLLKALRINPTEPEGAFFRGRGCDRCGRAGYSGRNGIFEVFQMDGELRKMIHGDALEQELLHAARQSGMATLLENALQALYAGRTTCEEVLRVLGPQNAFEMECPGCRVLLGERFSFCPFCGMSIQLRCRKCGSAVLSEWRACPFCGEKR